MTAAKDGVQGRRRLRIFAAATALVLLCAVCIGGVSGADVWNGESIDIDWAGSGTQADPYLITSAAELAGLAQKVNGGETYSGDYFKLTTDIDLAGKQWTPIGYASVSGVDPKKGTFSFDKSSNSNRPFSGTFDGNDKCISNLCLVPDLYESSGLFGYVMGGTIKDLYLNGEMIADESSDGVTYASVYISLSSGKFVAGSLVGLLCGGEVIDCCVIENGVFVPDGSQGNNRIFGGLIGSIRDANGNPLVPTKIDGVEKYPIGDYVKGDSSVISVKASYGKPWGLLVGCPTIGNVVVPSNPDDSEDPEEPIDPGYTPDSTTATYVVNIYEMGTNGLYSLISSNGYVGLIGNEVEAHYTLSEGFSLDYSTEYYSVTKGTIIDNKDGKYLTLNVYLKRNKYTLTIVIDSSTSDIKEYYYGQSIPIIIPPQKDGYTFLGWDTQRPSTMPANNLVITALWDAVDPKYTIVIPDSLIISEEVSSDGVYEGGMSVDVDITEIVDTGKVYITVSSNNLFRLVLTDYEDYSLGYNLYVGNSPNKAVPDENGYVVVGSFSSIVSTSIPLRAEVFDTPMYSGNYQDTLVFHVQYSF